MTTAEPPGGDEPDFDKFLAELNESPGDTSEVYLSHLRPETVAMMRDEDQREELATKIEKALIAIGIRVIKIDLGVSTEMKKAVVSITAFLDEDQVDFKSNKDLASMLYDENVNKVQDYLETLKKAVETGDKTTLGIEGLES